jgi:hypothetical protein
MNLLSALKNMASGGSRVAPTPEAAPTPVVEPTPAQALMPVAATPEPAPSGVTIPAEPAVRSSLPAGTTPLYTKEGTLAAYRTSEGVFVAVTKITASTALENLSAEDRRPVDPEEELRNDLPLRTSGRIQFLLATYESNHPERTAARIQNDIARYHFGGGDGRALRANPQGLQRNPEAPTPGVSNWGN